MLQLADVESHILGINNRDLGTFKVDLHATKRIMDSEWGLQVGRVGGGWGGGDERVGAGGGGGGRQGGTVCVPVWGEGA